METNKQSTGVLERYLADLLMGDRDACRAVIEEAMHGGTPVNVVYMDIIWPVMVEIERLSKEDKITAAQEAIATRINRTIVDQLQNKLPRKPAKSQSIVVYCSSGENEELGAQMVTDLFESDGWQARFVGSGVNNDDILSFVHSYRPDILLLYGTHAKDAPQVRKLIDTVRTINAFPDMRIMLSGGVFNRAEGLWEEIGADLYAATAAEAVRTASAGEKDLPQPQRTIKRRRRPRVEQTEAAQVEVAAE